MFRVTTNLESALWYLRAKENLRNLWMDAYILTRMISKHTNVSSIECEIYIAWQGCGRVA